eukprot:GHVP01031623.1.p1 GENE.GHVP01031623.1~~GHVP01031623.1.p1  ORF type:complete len:158 (-),score=31.45 GHVP01031623.1:33-506(-)
MAIDKTLTFGETMITLLPAKTEFQTLQNDRFSTEERALNQPRQKSILASPLPALNFLRFLGRDPQTMAADDLSWAAVNWLRHLANQVHGSLSDDQTSLKYSQETALSRASTMETPSAEYKEGTTQLNAEAPVFVPSFISSTRLTPYAPEFVPSGAEM